MRAFEGEPTKANQSDSKSVSASATGESQVESNVVPTARLADCADDLGCGLFTLSTALTSRPGTPLSAWLLMD